MVHVRYAGKSYEINDGELDLRPGANDQSVLRGVARWLGVDPSKMTGYVIDRRPSGTLVVRPEAIYG